MKEEKNILIITLLVLSTFFLVYVPLEFQVTEVWMLAPQIHPVIGSFFLVFLAVIFSLIDWQKLVGRKIFLIILFGVFITSFLVFASYRKQKLAREFLPKIYRVEQSWGIQAKIIKISGVNFFPIWRKGKVVVGEEEMNIKSWSEKLIVAEQQVPSKFGWFGLYIIRDDGIKSNKVAFEVRNPASLYRY